MGTKGKKEKKEQKSAPPAVSDRFAKQWAIFANGDGTYKIQEIYTFTHMWYSRKDIRQKCKEVILGNKKSSDADLIEKLKKILIDNSSPGKGKEIEYKKSIDSEDWTVILSQMKEIIKQG